MKKLDIENCVDLAGFTQIEKCAIKYVLIQLQRSVHEHIKKEVNMLSNVFLAAIGEYTKDEKGNLKSDHVSKETAKMALQVKERLIDYLKKEEI